MTADASEIRPTQQPQHAVCIRGLWHRYGQGEFCHPALCDINLTIAPGEIVVFLGPNGSGKTTLLKLLGGHIAVQEGSLQVLGRERRGATPRQVHASRRDVGLILPAAGLFPTLTLLESVRMALDLWDRDVQANQARALEALDRLGLGDRRNYTPWSLSKSQKKRGAIARALAHRPRLLLAVEPAADLDSHTREHLLLPLFRQLAREEHCAVVMLTHDMDCLHVADRLITLVDGRVRRDEAARPCLESSEKNYFLTTCPLLAHASYKEQDAAAERLSLERFPAGTVILQQGAPVERLCIIKSGEIEVFVGAAGKSPPVATLTARGFFGEAALLSGATSSATFRARNDVELYCLGTADFQACARMAEPQGQA